MNPVDFIVSDELWLTLLNSGTGCRDTAEDSSRSGDLLPLMSDDRMEFHQVSSMDRRILAHGQVALDYLTDILPFGDAWVRVHSLNLKEGKAPGLYNIGREEHTTDDERWRYVRNTPFRKTIETVGSLLLDVLSLKVLGRTDLFSEERK